ncbi:hypothetical protein LCGC14_2464780 [marine sediment metagenome]|uniref:Uncharacterized protein n=1 Tax=marine sediment metagenome TaxID=412755 RepID=A0A0F9BC59_9ZZZZ
MTKLKKGEMIGTCRVCGGITQPVKPVTYGHEDQWICIGGVRGSGVKTVALQENMCRACRHPSVVVQSRVNVRASKASAS